MVNISPYNSADMKRLYLSLLGLVLAGLLAFAFWHGFKRQAEKKREAAYHAALYTFQQFLRPGMNRKDVESYLRANKKDFRQMCCVAGDKSKHSWDDLTKIGEEKPPWFCSEHNVYVAFQFFDHQQPHETYWRADDLDVLKSVTIYHWLEGCL